VHINDSARAIPDAKKQTESLPILREFDARGKIDIRLLRMRRREMSGVKLGLAGRKLRVGLLLVFSVCSVFLCPLCSIRGGVAALLLLAKNLTLLGRPIFQPPVFRIEWNLSSILRARAVKPVSFTVSKLSRTKPRQINTSKINDFNPPEMNTCEKRGVGHLLAFAILLGWTSLRSCGGIA
jgi:hypothetical protein